MKLMALVRLTRRQSFVEMLVVVGDAVVVVVAFVVVVAVVAVYVAVVIAPGRPWQLQWLCASCFC